MSHMHAIVHAAAHLVPAGAPQSFRRGGYIAARSYVTHAASARFRIA